MSGIQYVLREKIWNLTLPTTIPSGLREYSPEFWEKLILKATVRESKNQNQWEINTRKKIAQMTPQHTIWEGTVRIFLSKNDKILRSMGFPLPEEFILDKDSRRMSLRNYYELLLLSQCFTRFRCQKRFIRSINGFHKSRGFGSTLKFHKFHNIFAAFNVHLDRIGWGAPPGCPVDRSGGVPGHVD